MMEALTWPRAGLRLTMILWQIKKYGEAKQGPECVHSKRLSFDKSYYVAFIDSIATYSTLLFANCLLHQ